MTTARSTTGTQRTRHTSASSATPKEKNEKPLTIEEKLDGLIAFLKDHGLHYDGSRAPEDEEAAPEEKA
jgi:hypothetical protein